MTTKQTETKWKEIVIPIINSEYKVIVCWGDSKQVEKVLKAWGHDRNDTGSQLTDRRGVCFYAKDCHPIIALPHKPKTPQEIGTLAHEATHAVRNIFEKLQEESSDEIFAHSVGAVVRETLIKLSNKRSK
jgi:hypothetical protein